MKTQTPPTRAGRPIRLCIALPGLHRVGRGAEVALESVAERLARNHSCQVTLFGAGFNKPSRTYRFVHVPCIPRERFEGWPHVPFLRDEDAYEELSFCVAMCRHFRSRDFDVTLGCSYPYVNWLLRAGGGRRRPAHIYVTQCGDWPAYAGRREYRFFSCDGLICVNPEHEHRNRDRWRCCLIPNGVDSSTFTPGIGDRGVLGVPDDSPLVLMVSALTNRKRVSMGIRSVAQLPDAHLVVAGDGPLRQQVDALGTQLLGGRYHRFMLARAEMPGLYRCADVLLHLSRHESFGIVIVEALACGLPIVSHDHATSRWILEDQGLLVDSSSVAATVAALSRALAEDGPQRVQRVAQGRALVERRFTWDLVASKYNDFIWQVLSGR